MITYPSEVLPALDYQNPFIQYLGASIVADSGTQIIKELLRNQEFTFAEPLVWNADGSVTKNSYVDEYISINNPPSCDLDTDDIIYVLHIESTASNAGNNTAIIRWEGLAGDYASIESHTWGVSYKFAFSENYSPAGYTTTGSDYGDKILVAHWEAATNTLKTYINGVLVNTDVSTVNASNLLYTMDFGLGQVNDKFKNLSVLSKTGGFDASEVASLVADPYQLFEKKYQETEYSLKCDINGQVVITGLSGVLNIEIGFTTDYIEHAKTWLVDARYGGGSGYYYRFATNGSFDADSVGISNVLLNGVAGTPESYKSVVAGDRLSFDLTDTHSGSISLFNRQSNAEGLQGMGVGYVQITDGNGVHYFDFNQTSAPDGKVYSLTSSLVVTLNNFPVDSGHVIEYEKILGHTFNGIDDRADFPDWTFIDGSAITLRFIPHFLANFEGTLLSDGSSDSVIRVNSASSMLIKINGVSNSVTLTKNFVEGRFNEIKIVRSGTNIDVQDLSGNSLLSAVATNGADVNFSRIAAHLVGNASNFGWITFDYVNLNNERNYDFTQIVNGEFVDTIGSQNAVITGEPVVFYDYSSPSQIVGYKFGGDNYGDAPVWIPTTTNWRFKTKFRIEAIPSQNHVVLSNGTHNNGIYINYNATQLNVWVHGTARTVLHDGIGSIYEVEYVSTAGVVNMYVNEVLVGTPTETIIPTLGLNFARRIESGADYATVSFIGQTTFTDVDDASNSRSYDFTLGDDDEIIDTENGQHGSIVNAKTSGFMPTVTTDVVTIGTNQDYATLSAAASVEKNSTDHKEFLVFGTVAIGGDITGDVDAETKYQGGLTIRGNAPYDGRLSTDMTGVSTLTSSISTDRFRWGVTSNKLRVKDIAFKALAADIGSGLAFNNYRDGLNVDIENVAFVGAGGTSSGAYGLVLASGTGTQSLFNIRQIMITNFSASGIWAEVTQVTVNLNDAIVFGNNTANNQYRGGVDCGSNDSLTAVNVLAYDNGNKDFYRISAGSTYLFSKDATATGGGSQTGVVVALSGDKLDQTTQDTYLKGKGWNGSDVAAWAYATGAVELTITVATLDSTITVYQPAVTTDTPLTISPVTLESASVSYAPLVTKDKLITTDTLDTTAIAYDPTVLKDKVITLDSLDNINITYAPTITSAQTVVVDTLNNVSVSYEPVVLRDKKIDLGFHTNTSTTYEPSVVSSKFITLNRLDNTSVIYGFNILQDKLIELNTMDNQGYVFEPEVIGGYRPIPVVTLYKAEGYGLHIRSAEHMNAVIQELAKRIEKLEGH